MKNLVSSFKQNATTGILRSTFENPNYWDSFSYHATSTQVGTPQNIFNFSNDSYWLGAPQEKPNNLTFCFRLFRIIVRGYEIKTSHFTGNSTMRARAWGFSGSNDGQNWINYDEEEHPLGPSETFFVEWSLDIPLRCFQLTTLKPMLQNDNNRFDVVNIDVYGLIINDKNKSKHIFNPLCFGCFLYHIFTFTC